MKKIGMALACVLVLALLTSCGGTKKPMGEVALKELTPEAEEVLRLLDNTTLEMSIHSYRTEEPFYKLSVWVEVYEYGALTNAHLCGMSSVHVGEKPFEGDIAVIVERKDGWSFTLADNRGGSQISSSSEKITPPTGMGYSWGETQTSESIEDGKEIALYKAVFSDGLLRSYDAQYYVEHPEALKENPMTILVKCRFDKE